MLEGAKNWFSNFFSKWWMPWLIGLLLLLAIAVGGAVLKVKGLVVIAGALSGLGAFGLMIGLMAVFVAPPLLAAAKKALPKAPAFLKSFLIAALITGALFALSYFALPALLAHYNIKFLASTGGAILSIIGTALSSAATFFGIMAKNGYTPKLLWENKGRAIELLLGFGAISAAVVGLVGVFTVSPLVAIIGIFAGALAVSGLFSGVGGVLMNWKKSKTEEALNNPEPDPKLLGGKQSQTPKPAADLTAAASQQNTNAPLNKAPAGQNWMGGNGAAGGPPQTPVVGSQGSVN